MLKALKGHFSLKKNEDLKLLINIEVQPMKLEELEYPFMSLNLIPSFNKLLEVLGGLGPRM